MRRELRGRALYRSRAVRRRRSLLAVVLLVMVALIVALVARGGGRHPVEVTYDRAAAVRYADRWAMSKNPAYWASADSDCANFVSQCVLAGGLRPFDSAAGGWRPAGTEFPAVGWVNCGRQMSLWRVAAGHTPYIVQTSARLPAAWRKGDVVYLGNTVDGKTDWQHVVICAGKQHGQWVYDSHTTAHRHVTMDQFYPAHFSLIRYCRLADRVVYR